MANENRSTSFKKAFTFVNLSHIPGPRKNEFFNYVRGFQKDILGTFTRVYHAYGNISSFSWPMNSVIIYSPEFAKKVLVDDAKKYEKGEQIEELKAVVGNGLATNNNYETWLRSRSIISREFGNKAVEKSSEIMTEIIQRNISFIKDGEVNIHAVMKKLTFEVACKIFLGLDADNEDAQKVDAAVDFNSEFTYQRIFKLFPLPYWIPTKKHRRFNKHFDTLNLIVKNVIDKSGEGVGGNQSVLSRLVNAQDPETGQKLNSTELRDEILTIMLAGHDTSSHSLTWVFALLAKHPEVQERIREEVLNLDLINAKDVIESGPYLQLALNESMRLYPAFPVLSRKTKVETTLGEYKIPAKTNVVIPIYVIQRSEHFWDRPLEYLPERFLKPEAKNSYAFLPFSRGQRRCIGEIFAMTEMTLVVIYMLKRFRISLGDNKFPTEVAAVTLKPKEDFYLKFESLSPHTS